MARARSRGGARRWLASAGLLGFGAVIGVMLGAILDGPRMLVRRWTEEVKVLELPRPPVDAPALEEYASLQTPSEAPAAPEPPAPASPRKDPPLPPEPAPSPEPRAEEPRRERGPSPEALIAEIQKKRAAPKSSPPEADADSEPVPTGSGRSGAVVQVAAYRDSGAAETLVRRLRRAGYDAYLSDRRADGPNKYRVRVQPPRGASVQSLATTLEERGYGVWITRE